ncbi:aldehyde dehydrogenase family protein [Streptomyces sp. NBC_00576]|uniref:aldehyde dehydrogenase family protein n=1 Tax=Streptomyces sp. NBC_00576 TaxID=2903665 RepID=UPI002E81D23B|nr:aldehyde dehydrogenase family protein [Streptomyces sp. NBC_00576]WUB68732.1 aldehyde dehydrogenase family protein [Streptomyces sp. NBC_00576]
MSEKLETEPAQTRADTVRTGLFIDGKTVETDHWAAVHDPASPDRIVGHAAAATPDHARAAVAAADAAFPGWAATPARRRAEIIGQALTLLDDSAAERATLMTRENGKIAFESQVEMGVFVARTRAAMDLVDSLDQVRRLDGPPLTSHVHRLPIGVVTIIVPFNWPIAILGASLPYALLAGNTVVVKPPPTVPLAMVRTLELFAAGLPDGVLNVVTGTNEAVAPLLTDPRVRKIVFTGSTAAGKHIMAAAAQNLASVTLELGGNDPAIVLDDADLDQEHIGRLVQGVFLTSGQVCMAVKRLYVHRSRYDELVDALAAALGSQRVGPGSDPASTMGPLNSAAQRDKVTAMLAEAADAGAEIRELGTLAPGAAASSGGHFLRPALVLDPDPGLRIVTEEQFGPALPILPFDDVDSVLDQVNNDWSGLCSSVWSADPARAAALAQRLRTGTTWINHANAVACDDRAPFGGFRQSGIGREMGPEGLLSFTEPHTITVHG